jgi:ATP synthase protein I
MSAHLNPGKTLIRRFMGIEILLLVVSSVFVVLIFGTFAGIWYSAGGLAGLIPEAIFAFLLFKNSGARAAKSIVQGFYFGETLKIITTVVILAVIFKYFTVQPLALLLGYIFIQIVHWLSPLILITKEKGSDTE